MIGYDLSVLNGLCFRSLPFGLSLFSPPAKVRSSLQRNDLVRLLSIKKNVLFVRWESEFDCPTQTSWWHVINDNPASAHISEYSSNTRSKIRRGNKKFYCHTVDREFIISNGYSVYKKACESYDTDEPCLSRKEFNRSVYSLHPNTEFWGVFAIKNGSLVAFSENYIEDHACFINTIWCDPLAMREYCSYSLFFSMNEYYLLQKNFSYVSDGARSLSHATNIHEFLISKFGFRKAYSKLNVIYHPLLAVILSFLFPFRQFLQLFDHCSVRKLSVLFKMEQIRRSCVIS